MIELLNTYYLLLNNNYNCLESAILLLACNFFKLTILTFPNIFQKEEFYIHLRVQDKTLPRKVFLRGCEKMQQTLESVLGTLEQVIIYLKIT